MKITVGNLWWLYVVVVVVAFIVFWAISKAVVSNDDGFVPYASIFFVATLIGAIVVFVWASYLKIDSMSSADKTSLSILLVIAFLLPVFSLFALGWRGEHKRWFTKRDEMKMKKMKKMKEMRERGGEEEMKEKLIFKKKFSPKKKALKLEESDSGSSSSSSD